MTGSTQRTTDELPTNHNLQCGHVVGTMKDIANADDRTHHVLKAATVKSGMRIAVSAGNAEKPIRADWSDDHTGGLIVDVTDVRQLRDDEAPSDVYGVTPSGIDVHIYPRRGKVELRRDGDRLETTTIVNTFGYPERPGFCADGSTCGCTPSKVVSVGGVEVAHCGHHAEQAAQYAADIAGVDLPDEPARLRDDHTTERKPDDYDVSETLDALAEQDDTERCDVCDRATVPDGDGGQTCPTGRHGEGAVTDGGRVRDAAQTPRADGDRRYNVPGTNPYRWVDTERETTNTDVLTPLGHDDRYLLTAPTHPRYHGYFGHKAKSYGATIDGGTVTEPVDTTDRTSTGEARTPDGVHLRGSPALRRATTAVESLDFVAHVVALGGTDTLAVWFNRGATATCVRELYRVVSETPLVVDESSMKVTQTTGRFSVKVRGGDR